MEAVVSLLLLAVCLLGAFVGWVSLHGSGDRPVTPPIAPPAPTITDQEIHTWLAGTEG